MFTWTWENNLRRGPLSFTFLDERSFVVQYTLFSEFLLFLPPISLQTFWSCRCSLPHPVLYGFGEPNSSSHAYAASALRHWIVFHSPWCFCCLTNYPNLNGLKKILNNSVGWLSCSCNRSQLDFGLGSIKIPRFFFHHLSSRRSVQDFFTDWQWSFHQQEIISIYNHFSSFFCVMFAIVPAIQQFI